MKRTLHFVNGMTAMMLGLVTLSIGATASFSNAAPLSKKLTPPQPKIVSIKTEVQGVSFGSVNDSLQWPSEAGTVNEVSDDTTGVSVTPSLQPGFYKAVKWAHTYQWSDDPVDPTSIVQNAVNLAKKYLNSGSFISKPQSVLVPVDEIGRASCRERVYVLV